MVFISSPKNTCICSFVSHIAAVQSSALAQIFCCFVTCKLRQKSSSAVCTGTQHGPVLQPCQAHPHICNAVSDSKSCFKRNSRCLMALSVLQAWVVLKPGQLHSWEAAWDLMVEMIKANSGWNCRWTSLFPPFCRGLDESFRYVYNKYLSLAWTWRLHLLLLLPCYCAVVMLDCSRHAPS